MTGRNQHLYDEIQRGWSGSVALHVMQEVRAEIERGAVLNCYFPLVRELSVVMPRRRNLCLDRGTLVYGFDELIEGLSSDHEADVLKCVYLDGSLYLFQIFFEVNSMRFVGCLYGRAKGEGPEHEEDRDTSEGEDRDTHK
jgi:hypothetical protein